jgi:hypothetical protein
MLNPRWSLPAVFLSALLVCSFSVFSVQAEIVYDNLDTYLGRYANEKREYGDELELAGTARTVTEFAFEYFGDFVPSADEMAKIRFYKNDVVISQFQVAPGTLLFESGWFPISPGYNSRRLVGLNVNVPDNFTFTIEFRGLSMQLHDEAGLVFYDPISLGNSFNDFWIREPRGNFALYGYPGVKNNFGVQVTAVSTNPNVRIAAIRKEAENVIISAQTDAAFSYRLFRADAADSSNWAVLQTISGTGALASFSPVPSAGGSGFFRILAIPSLSTAQIQSIIRNGPNVVISLPTKSGLNYTLQRQSNVGSNDWTGVQTLIGTGNVASFAPQAAGGSSGFFRVAVD